MLNFELSLRYSRFLLRSLISNFMKDINKMKNDSFQGVDLLKYQVEIFNSYVIEQIEPLFEEFRVELAWYSEQIVEVVESGYKLDLDLVNELNRCVVERIYSTLFELVDPDTIVARLPDGDNPIFKAFLSFKAHRIRGNASGFPDVKRWAVGLSRCREKPWSKLVVKFPCMQISLEEMMLNPTDVHQCLIFAFGEVKEKAAQAGVNFSSDTFSLAHIATESTMQVNAHWILFYEVFAEIMINAIKAMPGGGNVRVDCCKDGDDIVSIIEDEGVGISSENLPRVFDSYFTTGGTGLGLALVKAYIEDMLGGNIEVQSEVGKGTKFIVRLKAV